MGVYDKIIKTVIENGEPAVVRINGSEVVGTMYRGYYVIGTDKGLRIFDGEHIIEPDFRVFDVHLKQYIYYDYPVERLLETFGVADSLGEYDPILEVAKRTGYPPGALRAKAALGFLSSVLFVVGLYLIFTGNDAYYYLFIAMGLSSLTDSAIDAKYGKRVRLWNVFWALLIIAVGVYGVLFKL